MQSVMAQIIDLFLLFLCSGSFFSKAELFSSGGASV